MARFPDKPRAARARCFLLSLLLLGGAAPLASLAHGVASQSATPASETPDPRTGRLLQGRLSAIEGLQDVVANLEGGQARLHGTVLDGALRAQAAEVAAATPGVTAVDNRIAIDSSLRSRFDAAYAQVTSKVARLLASLPLLAIAALIVIVALWLAGVFSRRLHWLRLRSQNPYMNNLVERIVRAVIVLVGVLLALDLLGATSLVGAVLGSAGVVGLVLGFAFKDIAENYIAGILLSIRQPFAPGEHVRIDVHEGKIVALTSRTTILMTLDGNQLRLPNALVFKSVLLNFSQNPNRRFEFTVTIDGSESIRESQKLAIEAIGKVEGVLIDPAPSWIVVENTPAGIGLRFYGWIDQRASDLGKVRSEAIRVTKAAYAHAGIESPRTVYHVVASREAKGEQDAPASVEPAHAAGTDTSVNRDIDAQLAVAQRADTAVNLLQDKGDGT